MVEELDALSSDVTALSREIIGTVRLGLVGTAALWIVPQLLELVPRMHPHLHLLFREATSVGLDLQLTRGDIDIALLALPAFGSEVLTMDLFEEDLGLFLPRTHPLANRQVLTVVDLATVPLLLPIAGTNFRTALDAAAVAAGVTLQPRAELDSLRLMRSLMFQDAGFAILPVSAMPKTLAETWVVLPVEGLPPRDGCRAPPERPSGGPGEGGARDPHCHPQRCEASPARRAAARRRAAAAAEQAAVPPRRSSGSRVNG